jgi:hypothetical protein
MGGKETFPLRQQSENTGLILNDCARRSCTQKRAPRSPHANVLSPKSTYSSETPEKVESWCVNLCVKARMGK